MSLTVTSSTMRTCLVCVMLFLTALASAIAQEFRGSYRVVASSIVLDGNETVEGAHTLLSFGDTVEVVARPSAETFEVRAREQYFIVLQDAVIRSSLFSPNLPRGPVSKARAAQADAVEHAGASHHVLRLRAGMGPAIPTQSTDVVSTGLLWNAQVDLHIQRSNVHAVFGYHSVHLPSSDSTAVTDTTQPIPSVNERVLSVGVIVNLFSNLRTVNPYLGASYGIASTGINRSYFLLHLGMDLRVSEQAMIFVELTPTMSASPIAMQWVPLELGLKVEW